MKSAIVILGGLTIGAVMAIAVVQLLKVFIQELVEFASEAWHSPESH